MSGEDRIAVSINEAARLVGRKRWYIHRQVKSGSLPAYRPYPKADPLILIEDLHKWVRGEFNKSSAA